MILFLLRHKNTPWIFGCLTIILTGYLSYINVLIAGETGLGIISHQFSLTKTRALEIIALWGPGGIDLFLSTLWLDYVFPVCYALFLGSWLFQRLEPQSKNREQSSFLMLSILPFLSAFFDFIENAYQASQMLRQAELPAWVFTMTSALAFLKYLCLGLAVVALLWSFVRQPRQQLDELDSKVL